LSIIQSELVLVDPKSKYETVIEDKKKVKESEKLFFRLKGNESLREGWNLEKF
jgi:hypothetical protein